MDNQIHDLNHDTLMGFQELDSHLAIFESSNPDRDSSTPGATSISTVGDFVSTAEQPSHTIIVELPGDSYSHKFQSDVRSRAMLDKKSMFNGTSQYVFPPCSTFRV